jgi:hypothetical protein
LFDLLDQSKSYSSTLSFIDIQITKKLFFRLLLYCLKAARKGRLILNIISGIL